MHYKQSPTTMIGCDPVAHLDKEHAKEQIFDILAHIEDYQKLVNRNRKSALEKGDWKLRIRQMMEVLEGLGYECK